MRKTIIIYSVCRISPAVNKHLCTHDNAIFVILIINICIAEDPVYLCVLPDSDHEACPVDATSESNAVDTTDADTCTADSTDSTPKKKFLRKEDSGTYNFMPHYSIMYYGIVHV